MDSTYDLLGTAEHLRQSVVSSKRLGAQPYLPSVMLPVLSQDKTVSLELEVVLDEAHITYSIVMGQETMHDLQIDTKICIYA